MKNDSGFTLIEVLVSMTILSIGLLGLAGLQVTGLKNNQTAYYHSEATQLLYDMADRMRANSPATVRSIPANSPYLSSAWTTSPVAQAACATTVGCTTANMAQNDLYQWNTAIGSTLPGGTGTITVNGNVFTITINWDDNHDGVVNANDPSFSMSFQL